LRRYHAGDATPQPPLVTVPEKTNMRDLYLATETGHLAYLTINLEDGIVVHDLDPSTGSAAVLARFPKVENTVGIAGKGWAGRQFVLIRHQQSNPDGTADLEILLTTDGGGTRVAGHITHAFAATVRLHAERRVLYVTRAEQGTSNVFVFALDTGALAQVTQNTLPGVIFSGFQPFGQGALGVRQERRDDIWLMQQGAPPRSGNSAGR
jgi:hypothetical protein